MESIPSSHPRIFACGPCGPWLFGFWAQDRGEFVVILLAVHLFFHLGICSGTLPAVWTYDGAVNREAPLAKHHRKKTRQSVVHGPYYPYYRQVSFNWHSIFQNFGYLVAWNKSWNEASQISTTWGTNKHNSQPPKQTITLSPKTSLWAQLQVQPQVTEIHGHHFKMT
jgi:hypothetical protein